MVKNYISNYLEKFYEHLINYSKNDFLKIVKILKDIKKKKEKSYYSRQWGKCCHGKSCKC